VGKYLTSGLAASEFLGAHGLEAVDSPIEFPSLPTNKNQGKQSLLDWPKTSEKSCCGKYLMNKLAANEFHKRA
jgi:hypothetical protein